MAGTDPVREHHPATRRQAGYAAWIDDPAIPALFAILRDLSAAATRLDALRHDRPDLGVAAARGEIGDVAALFERCPDRSYGHGRRTRANGGACAGLWDLLAARRDAWIAARLEVDGFAAPTLRASRNARLAALCDAAIPVELAWRRFAAADPGCGSRNRACAFSPSPPPPIPATQAAATTESPR